ncbi:mannos-6-phosphate isomerase [Exidia glandulosa HHB12029]|uniref:Mannose-6-phosphate isomerase n=1 Tax=Exidia glandulosa HHB12029 TaxID=1314781 RepID=A0A165BXX5_EXIGL|nr:mannos-6-phosphate isomerase [Exidia glandulosa HHB12029]
MSSSTAPVFEITPGVQKYAWGKHGAASKVAQLAVSSPDAGTPYAELWMGTHPALPSTLSNGGVPLGEHLRAHPELLGDAKETYAGDLPFLFKILSIETALSIQAHPDKTFARELHAAQPNVYKGASALLHMRRSDIRNADPNHKPEMALALTPFVALCGFRPLAEIAAFLRTIPQLAALVPQPVLAAFLAQPDATTFKDVFAAIMTAAPSHVKSQLDALLVDGDASAIDDPQLREMVREIEKQYPGDVGVFCLFLLNIVRLQPGEAIFLGAGEPHAYISGVIDIVECMATSDNVLRAGLTPKARDVAALLRSLTYSSGLPDVHRVVPSAFQGESTQTSKIYDPPVPEFSVLATRLAPGGTEEQRPFKGPSVGIVTSGTGRVTWGADELSLNEGTVFFVGAGTKVTLSAGKAGELVVHRAFNE